jgi:hypothetical protein
MRTQFSPEIAGLLRINAFMDGLSGKALQIK